MIHKSDTVFIETERLRLRRWVESDKAPFARMNADPQVMEFMPGCLSREASDALVDRVETHFCQHGFGLYAAEFREEQRFIGYIGLWVPDFEAPFMPRSRLDGDSPPIIGAGGWPQKAAALLLDTLSKHRRFQSWFPLQSPLTFGPGASWRKSG